MHSPRAQTSETRSGSRRSGRAGRHTGRPVGPRGVGVSALIRHRPGRPSRRLAAAAAVLTVAMGLALPAQPASAHPFDQDTYHTGQTDCGSDGTNCNISSISVGTESAPTVVPGDTWLDVTATASTKSGYNWEVDPVKEWDYQIVEYDDNDPAGNLNSCKAATHTKVTANTANASGDEKSITFRIPNLTNGTRYLLWVRVSNQTATKGGWVEPTINCIGVAANLTKTTPQLAAPPKPTGVSATGGNAKVTLAASVVTGEVTKWQYKQATSSSGLSSASWNDISSTSTTLSHEVGSLTNGTRYYFKVCAVNSQSPQETPCVNPSDEVSASPSAAAPAKPTSFTATAGNGSVALAGAVALGTGVEKWQYQVKTCTSVNNQGGCVGGTYGSWVNVSNSASASLMATVSSGISNGNSYAFKARAVNDIGNGAASDEAVATLQSSAPAAPSNLTATAGAEQVTLAATTTGAGVTKWQYKQATTSSGLSSASWNDIASSASSSLSKAVTGLTASTTYYFKVRAHNNVGAGAESNEDSATPTDAASAPPKPTNVSATAGNAEVTLAASVASGTTVGKWQYKQATSSGGLSSASWNDISSTSVTLDHDVGSLTNGTRYYFKVRAHNGVGAGAESDGVSATPASAKPGQATLAATPGNGSVSLVGSVASGTTVGKWQYQAKTCTSVNSQGGCVGGTYGSWVNVSNSASASFTATVSSGISNGNSYAFKARAVNDRGNGTASSEAVATLASSAPPKPTGFTATGGLKRVTLAASVTSGTAVGKWQYQRATSSSGLSSASWTDVSSSASKRLSTAVTGLDDATAYWFKVRAHNNIGAGAASDAMSATTDGTPAKPVTFQALAGDNRVTLRASIAAATTVTEWKYRVDVCESVRQDGTCQKGAGTGTWYSLSGSATTSLSAVISTGIRNGNSYEFRVLAANSVGDGAPSDPVVVTLPAAPGAPTSFSVTPSSGEVLLEASVASGTTVREWQYQKKTCASVNSGSQCVGGAYGSWSDIASSNSATLSATVTSGVSNGNAYAFKVRAVNARGNGAASSEKLADLRVPPKPTALTATGGTQQVTLAARTTGTGILRWQYQRATTSAGLASAAWTNVSSSASSSLSTTITGLQAGTSYWFKVRAVSKFGASPASDTRSATTNSSTSTNPTDPTDPTNPTNPTNPGGNAGTTTSGSGNYTAATASARRFGAADRYENARIIAEALTLRLRPTEVSEVIVASGEDFPDAVAAAVLSKSKDAPLLLTEPESLHSSVTTYVNSHDITKVWIVGGTGAVSSEVETALGNLSGVETVERIAGASRYETALNVADEVGTPGLLCGSNHRAVVLTNGTSYADGLVAGPLAWRGLHPLLFTAADALPDATAKWLTASNVGEAVIVGGETAVGTAVVDKLEELGIASKRAPGSTRYETSANLAALLIDAARTSTRPSCFKRTTVGVALGTQFEDHLTTAGLLGAVGAPLLLVADPLPDPIVKYTESGRLVPQTTVDTFFVFGTGDRVPSSLVAKLRALIP